MINNKALFYLIEPEGCHLCECGCGQPTERRTRGSNRDGTVKGEWKKFINGHQNRRFIKNHNQEPAEGQFINKGYVYVLCPEHPHHTQGKYVKRSRLVMESVLGRYLTKKEQVHHINGNRLDDRPENLSVMSLSEHNILHRKINKMLTARFIKRPWLRAQEETCKG